ncbi:MAG: ribbon-helix-helix protein, CopG family, partial [Mariniphaga sp.]|nr:ribbon-helix-helix protein, CopG family [Mariniphaga sp.]
MAVTRFGVSLDEELLLALDKYVEENRFSNRSQAIRHLHQRRPGGACGALRQTLVHRREPLLRLP